MLTRRSLLGALGALPFVGKLFQQTGAEYVAWGNLGSDPNAAATAMFQGGIPIERTIYFGPGIVHVEGPDLFDDNPAVNHRHWTSAQSDAWAKETIERLGLEAAWKVNPRVYERLPFIPLPGTPHTIRGPSSEL